MARLQKWFGVLPPDIATIFSWSESLGKPLCRSQNQMFIRQHSFWWLQLLIAGIGCWRFP